MDSKSALLHVKNAKVLVALKTDGRKWYASSLAKESGLSYVYVAEMLDSFEKDGLITISKEGKIRRVSLTENGIKVKNEQDELHQKKNAKAPTAPEAEKEEKKEEQKA